jgi:hypothetical protein
LFSKDEWGIKEFDCGMRIVECGIQTSTQRRAMKVTKVTFIFFLVLGFLGMNHSNPCYAQNPTTTLTLLYSNNINGEIDPCPG